MNNKQRRAKAAREMAGLSVAEVAKRIGKSKSTIHAWEADEGSSPRNLEDLVALCQLYGITTDWYLEGREPIFRSDARPGRHPEFERIHELTRTLKQHQRKALVQLLESMVQ